MITHDDNMEARILIVTVLSFVKTVSISELSVYSFLTYEPNIPT